MAKKIILLVFTLLVLTRGAVAQYLWQETLGSYDAGDSLEFSVISSRGLAASVGGSETDTASNKSSIAIWRTNDTGLTWKKQFSIPRSDFIYRLQDIQQIDSLHTVAVGYNSDSGFFVGTTNGGATWLLGPKLLNGLFWSTHFSDSLHGILIARSDTAHGIVYVVGGGTEYIYTTTNGGETWLCAPFTHLPLRYDQFTSCFSYGKNTFRVFEGGQGIVYTTKDNWKNIDSTAPIVDIDIALKYDFDHCVFSGDTLVASGVYSSDGSFFYSTIEGIVARSTDGGSTWGSIAFFPGFLGIENMTPPNQDTIIAAGIAGNSVKGKNIFLLSTDNGITWNTDTLLLNRPYVDRLRDVTLFSNGIPLGIYGGGAFSSIPSILIRAEHYPSSVRAQSLITDDLALYPNPARDEITILCNEQPVSISIFDALGRTISSIKTDEQEIRYDIKNLPSGSYMVHAEYAGRIIIRSLAVVK